MMSTLADPNPAETAPDSPKRAAFAGIGRAVGVLVTALVCGPLLLMIVKIFSGSEGEGLRAFRDVARAPWFGSMIRDTLITVGAGVFGALVLGSLFAWLAERTNAEMSWLTQLMPVLPLFVPPLASAIGWVLLGTPTSGTLNVVTKSVGEHLGLNVSMTGPINIFTWTGVIALFILNLVSQVYLVVSAALRNLDPSLEEASRLSGVGPWMTAVKVTLPAIRPALINAALLALASGFALFSVPFFIGSSAHVDNLIVRVVRMTTMQYPARLDQASVLGIIVVVVIGSSYLLQRKVNKLARHAQLDGKTSAHSRVNLGAFTWVARFGMIVYVACAAVLPVVALIYVSLQAFWSGTLSLKGLTLDNYQQLFSAGSTTVAALRNSVLLGVIAATMSTGVVTIIAYFNERRPQSVLGRVADAVTKVPAAVSHAVLALALILALAGPPFRLQGSLIILLLGYLVLYLPQASINANAALSQLGPTLSEASLISGASEWRTLTRVVAPLMLPGLLAGWVMVFVLVAGDLTASAMLAGPTSQVTGSVMLDLATSGTYGLVAAFGVMITLLSTVIGGGVLILSRRTGRGRGVR